MPLVGHNTGISAMQRALTARPAESPDDGPTVTPAPYLYEFSIPVLRRQAQLKSNGRGYVSLDLTEFGRPVSGVYPFRFIDLSRRVKHERKVDGAERFALRGRILTRQCCLVCAAISVNKTRDHRDYNEKYRFPCVDSKDRSYGSTG